ncbi:hypothetical protein GCM10008955_12750 [Deinococcus malanensis]|uniref:Adenylate kinase n=1 Tax=Deinococcus malanensis TaxID=1706855 RepID=A0ABQ2EPY7_9DEIO|nr:hypothetical protein GCM10008955_12750 [Deinococcus malanensis]
MRRSIVIGTTGRGETTLAASLAGRLNVPCGEQDAWNHGPHLRETPRAQFRALVDTFTSESAWVMDGNSSKARDIGRSRSDTLVWFAPSLRFQSALRTQS